MVEGQGITRFDPQAETTKKDFWQDAQRVAAKYKQDPSNPQFNEALRRFNEEIVEPARVTNMLDTLFERAYPEFAQPSTLSSS